MGKKGVKENKEAKLRKREEARRKATRSKRIDEVIKYGPVLGAVVIAVVLGVQISNGTLLMSSAPYRSISSPEDLKTAFFSGDPALILCGDSTGATDPSTQGVNGEFLGAAERLRRRDVESIVIDCSAKLPSGKTTYERLKLNASAVPVAFHVQGGDKPFQLNPKLLSKDKSKKKKTKKRKEKKKKKDEDESASAAQDEDVGLKLASTVLGRVRKRFGLTKVKSSKVLLDACVKRRSCVLFVGRGDRLLQDNKQAKAILDGLVKKYRAVRWAYLDASRYLFSMKSQLPAELMTVKAGKKLPLSAVGFRRGEEDSILFSPVGGLISSSLDAELFIVDLLASDELNPIPKLPSIRLRPQSKPTKPSSTPESSKETASDTQTEQPETKEKLTPEELERRRRQRMEEEAEEFLAQEVEEEEEEETSDDFFDEDDYIVLD